MRRWKEKSCVGATSWFHGVADDSRIQKMRSLTLKKHSFTSKLEETILHGLSIPNPNFSEFAFLVNPQIRNCGFQSFKQLMS
jgi:hypothetical protein